LSNTTFNLKGSAQSHGLGFLAKPKTNADFKQRKTPRLRKHSDYPRKKEIDYHAKKLALKA
jgi:hypothetical protein